MATWRNLGKVKRGYLDVTLALCLRVMCYLPPRALRANLPEMSTVAIRSYSVCSKLYLPGANMGSIHHKEDKYNRGREGAGVCLLQKNFTRSLDFVLNKEQTREQAPIEKQPSW